MNDKTDNNLGQNLLRLRKEKGLSQEQLAKLSGLTQRVISSYENGVVNPPIENIKALAKALNIKLSSLLTSNLSNDIQEIFTKLDSRTIKKIKLILSLPKIERHMIYMMADAFKMRREKKGS